MKNFVRLTAFCLLLFGSLTTRAEGWVPLFNGTDLSGWKVAGDPQWSVHDGVIQVQGTGKEMGWLIAASPYRNFVFRARFKWTGGNSGIQFRSWPIENMVHGFQADLDACSDWINGHLYDQSECGVLVKPSQDFSRLIDWNGWNRYEITAIGPKVELFVNGVKSVEFADPTRDKKGIFAFQIHQGFKMDTFWKDTRIISLD